MSTNPQDKLAIARRGLGALKPPSKEDRIRWHLFSGQRKSYDEIANLRKSKVTAVQSSVERVEAWRSLLSASEIGVELNAIVMEHIGAVSGALSESLTAEHVIKRTNDAGKEEIISRSPDHKTRHEAIDRVLKIADRNLPRGGGVNIAVQQNAGGGVPAPGGERHLSFEELLRQRRQLKGLSNGDEVQEAEFEDVDETAEEGEDGDEES